MKEFKKVFGVFGIALTIYVFLYVANSGTSGDIWLLLAVSLPLILWGFQESISDFIDTNWVSLKSAMKIISWLILFVLTWSLSGLFIGAGWGFFLSFIIAIATFNAWIEKPGDNLTLPSDLLEATKNINSLGRETKDALLLANKNLNRVNRKGFHKKITTLYQEVSKEPELWSFFGSKRNWQFIKENYSITIKTTKNNFQIINDTAPSRFTYEVVVNGIQCIKYDSTTLSVFKKGDWIKDLMNVISVFEQEKLETRKNFKKRVVVSENETLKEVVSKNFS
jgi:hypothetical protein